MTDVVDTARLLVEKWISPVLSELKISDYTLLVDSGCGKKGDGHLGDIWKVTVQHRNGNLDLIIKVAGNDEITRKFTPLDLLYKNEVNFYSRVAEAMNSLQEEKRIEKPFQITKYYASSLVDREESIILENLLSKGFRLYERMKDFDEDHVILTLNHYAKYHALSFALRAQRPQLFQEIASHMINMMPLYYPNLMDCLWLQMRKCIEMLKENGLIEESKAAEKIAENTEKIMFINDQPPDEYTVITHGDCWSNNMMFKYDVITGKPIEMRFLDFQLSRVASPAIDLSYFLCFSASKSIINNVEKYLELYYESLTKFLKELGTDVENVYPVNIFWEHWKMYAKYGAAVLIHGLRFICADERDALSLASKEEFAKSLMTHLPEHKKPHDERIMFVFKKFVESDWTD